MAPTNQHSLLKHFFGSENIAGSYYLWKYPNDTLKWMADACA